MSARLFLTDYASYNNGTQFQFGHWVDLEDFSDADEFQEYIKEHFEEADKISPLHCGSPREETMFTDYEGLPAHLYSESMSTEEIEQIYKYIEFSNEYDIEDPSDILRLNSERCSETGEGTEIFDNDDEFFEMFFSGKPAEAVRAAIYGDYNYSHDFVIFNGYGNLESFDNSMHSISKHIDIDELLNWKLQNM